MSGYVSDDERAAAALRARGWHVDSVPWRNDADWSRFDIVVVRSTWDYQHDAACFLDVLERIHASGVQLENPIELLRWNLHKSYLRELAGAGVPVARTVWGVAPDEREIHALFAELTTDEIVIKPAVGANAGDVLRLRADMPRSAFDAAVRLYVDREFFAQPFLHEVVTEGEYALVYFDGEFSHAIRKTPAPGDFRVQEEHGGSITAVAADAVLRGTAARALRALSVTPLYARVDLVRTAADACVLMELELIEPALYLRADDAAPARFAAAIAARCAPSLSA